MSAKSVARVAAVAAMVLLAAEAAQAVDIATVPVGNPGNAPDTRVMGDGTTAYGSVPYLYNTGKYDVTAGQYTAFLNAVAATDTYALYDPSMANLSTSPYWGCGIQQNGASGSYTYSVSPTYANRPVNYVSFWDACRFANWLNNGQGGPATTEYGTYTLTTSGMDNNTITRNTGATWAVTSEDEWYKAAYYDPNKAGGAGYWLYPTRSDSITTAMANYNWVVGHPTDGGSYPYASPYGTYDQAGNVWEWNEAILSDSGWSGRGWRGGCFMNSDSVELQARTRDSWGPTDESCVSGFRVSETPEPATMSLLALAGLGMLIRRRSVRR